MKTFTTLNTGLQEGTTVEFKTSLLYCAGSSQIDDRQMDVITRTISSMMNKDGGSLYIGVNDRGFASSSITEEYNLLNAIPPFQDYHYSSNLDGYKRFIMDWVARNLGNFACTLLSFEPLQYQDITVCRIGIGKSKTPIWFKGNALFVRADASTRQLRGDNITNFIMQLDKADFIRAHYDDKALYQKRLSEIKKAEAQNGRLLVIYPNGEYIHEKSNKATMLEVIRRAGVSAVRNLDIQGRKGKGNTPNVPFVSDTEYLDNGGKTQEKVDGYYILTKLSKGDMYSKIIKISEGLGLDLKVEDY